MQCVGVYRKLSVMRPEETTELTAPINHYRVQPPGGETVRGTPPPHKQKIAEVYTYPIFLVYMTCR
jgi:hypothetical protein